MMFRVAAIFVLFMPMVASAASPPEAAEEVISENTKDEKCEVFFEHFMEYSIKEDFSKSDSLIDILDRQDSDLVDYCDKNRNKFLEKYR